MNKIRILSLVTQFIACLVFFSFAHSGRAEAQWQGLCAGSWVNYGSGKMCVCPDGSYGSHVGGRHTCGGGGYRQPQSRCPAGKYAYGRYCVPNGHTACGDGRISCPNHLTCYRAPSIFAERGVNFSGIKCVTSQQYQEIEKEADQLRQQKAEELHARSEAERKRALKRQKELAEKREKKRQARLNDKELKVKKSEKKINTDRQKNKSKILANTGQNAKRQQQNSKQVFNSLKEKSLLGNLRQTPAPRLSTSPTPTIRKTTTQQKPAQRYAYPDGQIRESGRSAVQDWLDGKKISPSSKTQEKLRQNRANTETEIKRQQIERQTQKEQREAYWNKLDPMSRMLEGTKRTTRRLVSPSKPDNSQQGLHRNTPAPESAAKQQTNCPHGVLDNKGYHECNTKYYGDRVAPGSVIDSQPKTYK